MADERLREERVTEVKKANGRCRNVQMNLDQRLREEY